MFTRYTPTANGGQAMNVNMFFLILDNFPWTNLTIHAISINKLEKKNKKKQTSDLKSNEMNAPTHSHAVEGTKELLSATSTYVFIYTCAVVCSA